MTSIRSRPRNSATQAAISAASTPAEAAFEYMSEGRIRSITARTRSMSGRCARRNGLKRMKSSFDGTPAVDPVACAAGPSPIPAAASRTSASWPNRKATFRLRATHSATVLGSNGFTR
jgi:hypothetical protein